jgi:hypothetical protein
MAHAKLSRKKTSALTTALFLVGLAICGFTESWWPTLMLVIGIPLALRQYLLGRPYDMAVTLVVFVGVYITVIFSIPWKFLLPILFTIGAIYIFFREWFGTSGISEEEKEEDINHEIEESEKKD